MTEQVALKTNHNVRVVNLVTGDSILCIFGEVRSDEDQTKVVGYRMIYPYALTLGEVNSDGTIPIEYKRWCPYSPIEEHRLSGDHIISVVYPDNNILDNFVSKLKETGLTDEQIFFPEEGDNGDNSEPAEAGE